MKKIVNNVTWKISGEAGEGIMVTGLLFSKSCVRAGLKAFDYTEYPSLIRGGHNTYLTQVGEEDVFSHDRSVEILVALNQESIVVHIDELSAGGAVLFDPDDKKVSVEGLRKDILYVPLQMAKIASDIAGNRLMRNTVALGASFALLEFPKEDVHKMLSDVFHSKGKDVIQQNIDTFNGGYDSVSKQQVDRFGWKIEKKKPKGDIVVTGIEAIAIGAIAGGCKFYSAYPMTPASSILGYMADHAEQYGMVVKHAEDEISVINMAIGAGHMGTRSMCATSGGGFALMNEGYGLAAITETPVVIVLVQRPGPATGLPTWTGQGDLQYALHAAQGEFPRFVVAPGDVIEAFEMTAEALNIAEEYQTPVILISDKQLAESHQTVAPFDSSHFEIRRGKQVTQKELDAGTVFFRYESTVKDGVSPRSFPGMKNGIYVANSDEHDGKGFSEESSENAIAMFKKRQRKFDTFKSQMPQPQLIGDKNADVTFVFWGSVKGAVVESIKRLKEYNVTTNYLQIAWVSPFPDETVTKVLKDAKRPVLVENNMEGQLGNLIREKTGFDIKDKILKFDGRPFFSEEIAAYIIKK